MSWNVVLGHRKHVEIRSNLARVVRWALRPVGEAVWPAAEAVSRVAGAALSPSNVYWSNDWNGRLEEAFAALPVPAGCTRQQYRALLHPTKASKRHALVEHGGVPIALISLRRRMRFWEPVAYQILPNVIAPAVDPVSLGQGLAALGVEVHVPAGLEADVSELGHGQVGAYDVYQIDLTTNYEDHWHKKNQRHLSTIRRARRKCADLEQRIDAPEDLEWIVETWRKQWALDPGQEVSAAEDRVRCWSTLARTSQTSDQWCVHTIQLLAGARRVAGVVLLCRGGVASFQCWARDTHFDNLGAGNRALDVAIEWAAENGYQCFDLGGGSVKHRWGPVGAKRYRVTFRPWAIRPLRWMTPD
jgi:hypothetical protein